MNPSNNRELETLLYEERVLVFIEVEPQSNKYNQVFLTAEQYKNVTEHLGVKMSEPDERGIEQWFITQSEEEYDLPDLKTINNEPRRPTSV